MAPRAPFPGFNTPFDTHALIKRSGLPLIQPRTVGHLRQVQNSMQRKISDYYTVFRLEFRKLEDLRRSQSDVSLSTLESGLLEEHCQQVQFAIDRRVVMIELRTDSLKVEWRQTLLDLMEAKEQYALTLGPEARARYYLADWKQVSDYMVEMHRRRVAPLEQDQEHYGFGLS